MSRSLVLTAKVVLGLLLATALAAQEGSFTSIALAGLRILSLGAPPEPDLKAELMVADRAFAQATAVRGLDGWMSFLTDDAARMERPGAKFVVGREAIRKQDASIFADLNRKLVWDPVDAHAFADGRSGVTSGRYKVLGKSEDGKERVLATGGYVTWWRKTAASDWRVIFDTGSPDAATRGATDN